MTARGITVMTPWDHSQAAIVVDMTVEDIKRLQSGRCFNGICRNGWTFLLERGRKGRIKAAHCWQCAELKYCKGLLSGCPVGTYWVVEKGKVKLAGSWLRDIDTLVKVNNARVIAQHDVRRAQR